MTDSTDSTLPPRPSAAVAGPVITRTEVTWRGDRLFDGGHAGRTHRIDANAKEAPGPVETLLNALATCASVDVIEIIAKRRTPVERLSVRIAAERRPEAPRRVRRIDIDYHIDGDRNRTRACRACDSALLRALLLGGGVARARHRRQSAPHAERRNRRRDSTERLARADSAGSAGR